MDRMTVDVALAALTVAFAVYWKTGSWWKLFIVLVLACLVRETGLLLVGGRLPVRVAQPAVRARCAVGLRGSADVRLVLVYPPDVPRKRRTLEHLHGSSRS